MNWAEANEAIKDAQRTISAADQYVGDMARICVGRLRKANVSPSVLNELKRELAKWDMHRGSWK